MEWNSETCRISSRPARWRHFRPLSCSFGLETNFKQPPGISNANRTGHDYLLATLSENPGAQAQLSNSGEPTIGGLPQADARRVTGAIVPLTCLGDHPETVLFSLLRIFTHCRRAGFLCSTVFDTECFGDTEHYMSVACGLGPISTKVKQCPVAAIERRQWHAVVGYVVSVGNSASIPHKPSL